MALAKARNDQGIKSVFQKILDTRLKLRALGTPNDVQLVYIEGTSEGQQRYVAYFLDADALESTSRAAPPSDNGKSKGKFDIRNGSRFDLIKPDTQLKPAEDVIPQERMIS